jgi:hypothetical protein
MYSKNIEERENEIHYLERVRYKLATYEESVAVNICSLIDKLEREIAVLKIIRFIKNKKYKVQS